MNPSCRFVILNKFDKIIIRNLTKVAPKKSKWQSVVGLEVHAQISTNSKLFSGSGCAFGSPLNSSVSLFDAAIPGTLPVLNKHCVELAVKTALALNCEINPVSMFDRKHYFYADLPAGYQITQQRAPLARKGQITYPVFTPGVTKKPYYKTVRLHQLQLEQDSGKSLHDDLAGRSLVDLNRAGVPLMELVFEPDIEDAEEAASLVKELALILKSLECCSCKMEEGALRVDANVSLHKPGTPLGTRTEIKNIGSIRNVAQAVNYEIERQRVLLDAGEQIQNETRSWDAASKRTVAMRDKEVQQDYRFMPEPNLPPLHLAMNAASASNEELVNVQAIVHSMPMLPEDKRKRLAEMYNLPQETLIILVNEEVLLDYFTQIMDSKLEVPPKTVANFLINDLLTFCNRENISVNECKISSNQFIDLFKLMQAQTINLHYARLLLNEMHSHPDKVPAQITKEKNWEQINDPQEIEELCRECVKNNPKVVEQFKKGKEKLLYALVGDVAKKTDQRANMAMVVEKLQQMLKS